MIKDFTHNRSEANNAKSELNKKYVKPNWQNYKTLLKDK